MWTGPGFNDGHGRQEEERGRWGRRSLVPWIHRCPRVLRPHAFRDFLAGALGHHEGDGLAGVSRLPPAHVEAITAHPERMAGHFGRLTTIASGSSQADAPCLCSPPQMAVPTS